MISLKRQSVISRYLWNERPHFLIKMQKTSLKPVHYFKKSYKSGQK